LRPPPPSTLLPYTTLFRSLVRRPLLELSPVLQALRDRLLVDLLALELEEAGDLAHGQIEARRASSVSRCCLASTWRYSTGITLRSEEHTSELQSLAYLVCR